MSQQINLFNPILLKQKKYFSARTMLQALSMILAGAVLMAIYANMQLNQLRAEAAAVTTQLQSAHAQQAALGATAARQRDPSLSEAVRRSEAQLATLQRVVSTLGQRQVGNTSGYSDYMRAFARQISDGIWLTAFSIRDGGRDISLTGAALRPELVPSFLGRLSKEPTMQGRAFDMLEMQAAQAQDDSVQPYVAFTVRSGGPEIAPGKVVEQ